MAAFNGLRIFGRARFVLAVLDFDRATAGCHRAAPTTDRILLFISGSTWHRVHPFPSSSGGGRFRLRLVFADGFLLCFGQAARLDLIVVKSTAEEPPAEKLP